MCFLLLAAASLSCATTTFAQVTSAIPRQVIDSSGAVVESKQILALPRIGQIAAKFVF